MKEDSNDNYLFLALLAILVIVVALFIYSLLIGRTPETFTQVWLGENPDEVNANEEFSVNFSINNKEGMPIEYGYRIIAENEAKAEGTASVGNEEINNITESISFNNASSEKQKVLIEITKPEKPLPYTLWFWVKVEEAE